MVREQVLLHSKAQVLEQVHNKVLVQELARSKVLEQEQELVHNMAREQALEHSTAQELVPGSISVQVPGSILACSNAHASGGSSNARTSSREELGSILVQVLGSSNLHHG